MKTLTVFLLFFFIFAFVPLKAAENRYNVPSEESPFIGPKDAPVTIIEFIDYQ